MNWIDTAEINLINGLIKMSNQGSVQAATIALKILSDKRRAQASQDHHDKLKEYKASNTSELIKYLGSIGADIDDLKRYLNKKNLKSEELELFRIGKREREIEIKAIELSATRAGSGTVKDWMILKI